jgi:hypothetical protein
MVMSWIMDRDLDGVAVWATMLGDDIQSHTDPKLDTHGRDVYNGPCINFSLC